MTSQSRVCLSARQEKILNTIIREYTKSARPVSSKSLERRYGFGVCPATIRIEMQKLAEKGFISQPHTSAGRIPTDKGYRFFVDSLLKENSTKESFDFEIKKLLQEEIINSMSFLRIITKNLALISSNLALGYLFSQKILWKEGWEKVIQEPEFSEKKNINNFFEMLYALEREIEGLSSDDKTSFPIKVYIGKENPFAKVKEFSIIVSNCRFFNQENGVLAILGPKRMDYGKNINSLNFLIKALEEI